MNCLERCSIAIAGVGWNGLDMLPAWMLHLFARQWPSGVRSSQGFLRVLWQLGATNAYVLILHWLPDIEKQPASAEPSPAFSVGRHLNSHFHPPSMAIKKSIFLVILKSVNHIVTITKGLTPLPKAFATHLILLFRPIYPELVNAVCCSNST